MLASEIKKMETVCQLAAQTLKEAEKLVQVGMTTLQINDFLHEYILSLDCTPAPLNYHGFPKSICTSLNDVICHGVPQGDEVLQLGDIINIDVTLKKDGFFGDTSRTFFVGPVSDEAKKITECAREAMYAGIAEVKANTFTGNIGYATEMVVNKYKYHVVRNIGGHGIGKKFHLNPFVPGCGKKNTGEKLQANTCITVEPMINQFSHKYQELAIPKSSVKVFKTLDKSLSAQFEHTILVKKNGYEILTEW